jgi:hypothetical protein
MIAARSGSVEIVKFLLDNGSEMEAKGKVLFS